MTPFVLIVDDSEGQAHQIASTLESQGFEVSSASNGRAALEAARQRKPALIICDVVTPEMSGYELCAHVKDDPQLRSVPVILLTTLSDSRDVIRGLECRADHFVLKPCDTGQLMKSIRFVLSDKPAPRDDEPGKPLEIEFGGTRHQITANRLQILNLLLSTHEAAMLRTSELERSNEALRQAQHALIQQERLRALGQMASGIAHDINNAISPIALYTEALLERETTLSERARGYLTTIQRAIDDVAQTVDRMREFYRPRESELQLSDVALNPLVQQVLDLTRARWNDLAQQRGVFIELKPELGVDLQPIRGAENEIRDALTNLIFNAVDALPKGGRIEVLTRMGSLTGPQGSIEPCVILEVKDDGVGMDEETRRRCLEPFFTTKGDRGTGLGLAMV